MSENDQMSRKIKIFRTIQKILKKNKQLDNQNVHLKIFYIQNCSGTRFLPISTNNKSHTIGLVVC